MNKSFVRALAIYVVFPEQASHQLPPIHTRLENELPDFIRSMSEGRQILVVETALRLSPFDSLCYLADSSMGYYQDKISKPLPEADGLDIFTDEILDKVYADHPDFPARYEVIFLNVLGNFLLGSDGFAALVRGELWQERFKGRGAIMDLTAPEVFLGVAGHEYGHLLGAQHPPYFLEKSFGDYELMDQLVHRLAPFSVQNLMDIGWIAPERVQAVDDTLYNVRLDDIRRGGKVLLLEANRSQYFLVANHQGTDYDSAYQGRGLLIWHQAGDAQARRGYYVWDLETAAGLYCTGETNPYCGVDVFDYLRDYTGEARDFFQPASANRFGPETNPNTNFYDRLPNGFNWRIQSQPSGVALKILHQQGATIFVDVFVPNKPPRILEVKGPEETVEPFGAYPVETSVEDDHFAVQAELLYRYGGKQEFETLAMDPRGADCTTFTALLPFHGASTMVEYYVRVIDKHGLQQSFPANAPDKLLSFVIKAALKSLVRFDTSSIALHAGESVQLPVEINNDGDYVLHFRSESILHESLVDDRAFAGEHVSSSVYVPFIFYDPQANLSTVETYERAATIYLRTPSVAQAWARLHLLRNEQTLYLYCVMLEPQLDGITTTLDLFWHDDNRNQHVQVQIPSIGDLQIFSQPGLAATANFLRATDPHLRRLRLNLPLHAVMPSSQHGALQFRAVLRRDSTSQASWPSAIQPEKFGAWYLDEFPPEAALDMTEWQVSPGERQIRYLRVNVPACPWSEEIRGGIVLRLVGPFYDASYFPFRVKITDFRSRFGPDSALGDEADTCGYSVADEKSVPGEFRLQDVYPNPFYAQNGGNATLHFSFYLSEAAPVRLEIFNIIGQRLAIVTGSGFIAGRNVLLWKSETDTGERLRAGIYFVRLAAGERHTVQKFLVLN